MWTLQRSYFYHWLHIVRPDGFDDLGGVWHWVMFGQKKGHLTSSVKILANNREVIFLTLMQFCKTKWSKSLSLALIISKACAHFQANHLVIGQNVYLDDFIWTLNGSWRSPFSDHGKPCENFGRSIYTQFSLALVGKFFYVIPLERLKLGHAGWRF